MNLLSRLFGRKVNGDALESNSFESIALEKGYCTTHQLELAARKQQERMPIGDVLIAQKAMTSWQRDEVLLEQRARKGQGGTTALELERQRIYAQRAHGAMAKAREHTTNFRAALSAHHNEE